MVKVVFKARHKSTRQIVALKKVLNENEKKEGFPITTIREINILKTVKHTNIVNLIEVCYAYGGAVKNPTTFYLVFEYCEHDLAGLLQNRQVEFNLGEKKMIMKHLLNALYYLHCNNFLHRDLKASNILITSSGILKLADFGLSRWHKQRIPNKYTSTVVTLWYRPPEVLLGDRDYGPPIDIWGAGCVMAELWTRDPILKGTSDINQLQLISQLCGSINPETWPKVEQLELYNKIGLPEDDERKIQDRLKDKVQDSNGLQLLDKMLTINPEERINSDTALTHEFFYCEPMPCNLNMRKYQTSMFQCVPPVTQNGHTNQMQRGLPKNTEEYVERIF